jgi:hypothetical protein
VTPADDSFHAPTTGDLFWTETIWLGFAVEARKLSGAIYAVFRPNQSVTSLGVYLWDDTGRGDQDCLYFHNYWHLPLPGDLRAFELPHGFSYRCIEPLTSYEVHYDDNVELALDPRVVWINDPRRAASRSSRPDAGSSSSSTRGGSTVARANSTILAIPIGREPAYSERTSDKPQRSRVASTSSRRSRSRRRRVGENTRSASIPPPPLHSSAANTLSSTVNHPNVWTR